MTSAEPLHPGVDSHSSFEAQDLAGSHPKDGLAGHAAYRYVICTDSKGMGNDGDERRVLMVLMVLVLHGIAALLGIPAQLALAWKSAIVYVFEDLCARERDRERERVNRSLCDNNQVWDKSNAKGF